MKISFVGIISLLFVSLFVGCVVIALPISLIPSLTQNTTARLLCKPGTFEVRRRTSDDGHNYTNYKCMDKKGVPQDITFQALAVPGVIAAGGIFVVFGALSLIRGLTTAPSSPSVSTARVPQTSFASVSASVPASESRADHLKELKDMYDSNLISAEDYERKKKEILDQL